VLCETDDISIIVFYREFCRAVFSVIPVDDDLRIFFLCFRINCIERFLIGNVEIENDVLSCSLLCKELDFRACAIFCEKHHVAAIDVRQRPCARCSLWDADYNFRRNKFFIECNCLFDICDEEFWRQFECHCMGCQPLYF